MPKSKRAQLLSLTKTKPARKEMKVELIEEVRAAAAKYAAVYVFSHENMRTEPFKNLRVAKKGEGWKFFLGKNKVMQLALGLTRDTAVAPGLDELAVDLRGDVGLLFTDAPAAAVESFIAGFGEPDFARAGFVPSETLTQPAGPIVSMAHSMHDELRKLGMPVALERGVIMLPQPYTLCRKDKAITPEQGRLLKHFGHQLAVFRLGLVACVRGGTYTALGGGKEGVGAGEGAERARAVARLTQRKTRATALARAGGAAAAAAAGGAGGAMDEEEEEGEGDDE